MLVVAVLALMGVAIAVFALGVIVAILHERDVRHHALHSIHERVMRGELDDSTALAVFLTLAEYHKLSHRELRREPLSCQGSEDAQ